MAYNQTPTEKNLAAARDLALKLKLEHSFKTDLRKFFNKLNKKFKDTYLETGQIVPANIYKNDLKNLLKKNYQMISKHFNSQIRMNAKHFLLNIETKAVDDEVNTNINNFVEQQSNLMAKDITKTNQEQLGAVVDDVKKQAAVDGTLLNQTQVANQAFKELEKKSIIRTTVIAGTETQKLAEYSKFTEAQSVISNLARINQLNPGAATKQWVTVLDERTRPGHVIADGQTKKLNDPFLVDGDKLMTPGDSSLGAGLGNVINCRCSVVYSLDESTAGQFNNYDEVTKYQEDFVAEVNLNGENYGLVRGYAVTYDKIDSDNMIFTRKAIEDEIEYLKSLGLEGIPMYDNHEYKDGVGGFFPLDRIVPTKYGLYVEGYIDLVSERGKRILEGIRNRKRTGFSVGSMANDKRLMYVRKQTNGALKITKYPLSEISIVDEGAVPGTDLLPVK